VSAAAEAGGLLSVLVEPESAGDDSAGAAVVAGDMVSGDMVSGDMVSGATDELSGLLSAVEPESADESCADSVQPAVSAMTAPTTRTAPLVVRDKRMISPSRTCDQRHSDREKSICQEIFDLQDEDRSLRWSSVSKRTGGVMKLANHDGRLVIVLGDGIVDVADASAGRFSPDPQSIYERWDELRAWPVPSTPTAPLDEAKLLAPVPRPRQVFAIGLNYAGHAAEAGLDCPEFPPTFTKFPTCLAGPDATVVLPSEFVDWEVELVLVVGRHAYEVPEGAGWSHIAGVTVGQDLSERIVQTRPPAPQFSLGKSFPGFGPTGPWVVTPGQLADPDDLEIGCAVNGEEVQKCRTSDLIFGAAALIHLLSSVTPLLPGDLIFTGTPAGVGATRNPPRFLAPGDELVSTIAGVGTIRTHLIAKEQSA
jgi:2-keto-4-pentenoate hydratase/2-oxohepta-3-ene-1,7-dioic acid hydratase in catechol pathway